MWRPLPWQQDLWIELTAQILQNRLSHALLLSGPQGVGKRWFARALVAFLLCEQRSGYACGRCRSCQQLAVGAHPNASVVGPDGLLGLAMTATGQHEQGLVHWQPDADKKRRDISIDAARKLISRFALASHYGGARMALVDPADALNSNSVNALLKTIEEPPPATHLILIGERPQSLPATLRSRCQRIRFAVPSASAALAWLKAQGTRDEEQALQAAHGAPLRALELGQGDALAQQREWAELWNAVGRRRKDPVSAAATIERDAVAAHLQWVWSWLHAQFRTAALAPTADAKAFKAWTQVLDEVVEANRLIGGNAQPQMLLESLFVQWLRLAPALLGSR
ncbi:MAG: DNA polymerase III subunit delta' [Sinimarinibacterium sp.]|jgi:DNA polymerase-3 subunit delta'